MSVLPLATIRDWRPGVVSAASVSIRADQTRHQQALRLVYDARQSTGLAWTGPGSRAAAAVSARLASQLQARIRTLGAWADAVHEAAKAIVRAQDNLESAASTAARRGWVLQPDGTPLVTSRALTLSPDAAVVEQAADDRALQEIRAYVEAARLQATRADEALAVSLGRTATTLATMLPAPMVSWLPSSLTSAVLEPDPAALPDPPATGLFDVGPARLAGATGPTSNAAWWAGLSRAQQMRVISEHPEWIADRDGVPAWARDRANRHSLAKDRAAAERSFAAGGGVAGPLRDHMRLVQLRAVESALVESDGRVRRLLSYRVGSGGQHAVIAVGDPDRAARVGVFVPGFGSQPKDAPRYARMANRLVGAADAMRDASGDPGRTAMVIHIGNLPQWHEVPSARSVLLPDAAAEMAPGVADTIIGLRSRPVPPEIELMGYSYGSVVAGLAVRQNPGHSGVTLLGSPGTGIRSSTHALVKPGRVNAMKADLDYVTWAKHGNLFGPDPSGVPGGQELATHPVRRPDGTRLKGVSGHTSYDTAGSTVEHNLSAILAGQPQHAVRAPVNPPPPQLLR